MSRGAVRPWERESFFSLTAGQNNIAPQVFTPTQYFNVLVWCLVNLLQITTIMRSCVIDLMQDGMTQFVTREAKHQKKGSICQAHGFFFGWGQSVGWCDDDGDGLRHVC